MSNKDSLRHLLAMAAVDGGVTIEELRLLGDRAISWGITDDDFEMLLAEAVDGDVPLHIPEDEASRRELLSDLVRMMAADGELHQNETQLFAVVASKMGISDEQLNAIIDETIQDGLS